MKLLIVEVEITTDDINEERKIIGSLYDVAENYESCKKVSILKEINISD